MYHVVGMMYTQFSKFTCKTLKMARMTARVNSYIFDDYLGIFTYTQLQATKIILQFVHIRFIPLRESVVYQVIVFYFLTWYLFILFKCEYLNLLQFVLFPNIIIIFRSSEFKKDIERFQYLQQNETEKTIIQHLPIIINTSTSVFTLFFYRYVIKTQVFFLLFINLLYLHTYLYKTQN